MNSFNKADIRYLKSTGLDYCICDVAAACEKIKPGAYRLLPYSFRILAENIARNESSSAKLSQFLQAILDRSAEVDLPFRPTRVVLQDLLGTPALVDLAGLRDALAECGGDPRKVNPAIPAHLIVDHSLNVMYSGNAQAMERNLAIERIRNAERFAFLSWCNKAFDNLSIIPSGTGIVHQINLERLTSVVTVKRQDKIPWAFPDTLVGTDSHTTMINAIGVLGWGVGGIEAEAAMLGEPLILRLPQTVGVRLDGTPRAGILATDVVLSLTEVLRKAGVVGVYLEFYGPGVCQLSLADRATISNMAPEFGATAALFPIDHRSIEYLRITGRDAVSCALVQDYAIAQGLWNDALEFAEYDRTIVFNLSTVTRCIAGPIHPHQRIELSKTSGETPVKLPARVSGQVPEYTDDKDTMGDPATSTTGVPTSRSPTASLPDGAVVIAAITSCTNTSNPRAVIAAGLLARNARRRGLRSAPWTKTSFAPGSRVVVDYLAKAGLNADLDALGFNLIGFGCTTCNGMSGPLDEDLARKIRTEGTITAAVLSGNRNFEGRIHPLAREAYIMSPPLVVAYAIAGNTRVDLERDPLGHGTDGAPVFLVDIWPSDEEIDRIERAFVTADLFTQAYGNVPVGPADVPDTVRASVAPRYSWDSTSTYIRRPPYWSASCTPTDPSTDLISMRPLAILGDHITTDHISPSGAILPESDAGRYLISNGINPNEFNSYGTRRGNHEVGMRATFANLRLRNEMVGAKEGPLTLLMPDQTEMSIFSAAMEYSNRRQPLIVVAGREYGSGSSRDWAAKGPRLLGVRVVLAESFERIHRSNLAGMGVLPVEFIDGATRHGLRLTGQETFNLLGIDQTFAPGQNLVLQICRANNAMESFGVRCRLDTHEEIAYFRHGGVLPQLLAQYLAQSLTPSPSS